ncbi:hypothetical protein GWK47_040556 [Chionoecetes opilio]|uniref:Uncharacterized protein n=1 Tax=Chionoecetes opilio TaxID=41210 RepID=A0A8J4YJC0_CHIOP|nr:hypothetical protein GWK47_040556 [Chionoecetes opilio]
MSPPQLQSLSSWGRRQVTLQAPYNAHLYQLKAPTILNAKLPEMYHVTRLRKEDASAVWTNWIFNNFDSVESVRNGIIHFPSVGIRERGPEDGAGSLQEEAERYWCHGFAQTNSGGWETPLHYHNIVARAWLARQRFPWPISCCRKASRLSWPLKRIIPPPCSSMRSWGSSGRLRCMVSSCCSPRQRTKII